MNKDFLTVIDDNTSRLTRVLDMLNEVEISNSTDKEKLVRAKNLIAASIRSLEFAKSPATKSRIIVKRASSNKNTNNNNHTNVLGK